MSKAAHTLITGFMLAATATATAAPYGTLTFLESSGIASPSDSIPVWMRLTIDPSSEPLVLDSSLDSYGVNPADIPADWAALDYAYLSTFFVCSGTFTAHCTDGPPYSFEFNSAGPDAINLSDPVHVAAGSTRDYLFGTFTPSAGPVAPGTYTFFNSGISLQLSGQQQVLDGDGNPLFDEYGDPVLESVETYFDIAAACSYSDPSCAFTRTVAAIPEPETYAMMLVGLGLVGVVASRRRRSLIAAAG